jgi:fatty acid kinase fatty acid binding subunit
MSSYNRFVTVAEGGSSAASVVSVVVDSSTCLDPETARALGVTVVPMQIVLDGRGYRDLVEVSPEEFYRSLRSNAKAVHSTASPTVGDYLNAFESAPGEVLCLTVASKLSSMLQSASLAADAIEGKRVEVMDSGTAAGGLRLLALRAARLAQSGQSVDEIAADLRRIAPRVRMFGMLDSIEYLARSGRVPQVASWTAGKLGVKPVIELTGGSGRLVTLVRGQAAGRRALADTLLKRTAKDGAGEEGEGIIGTVFHADALDEAEALEADLKERLPAGDFSISQFTPAMGVHTGPGVLGHAFYVDSTPA